MDKRIRIILLVLVSSVLLAGCGYWGPYDYPYYRDYPYGYHYWDRDYSLGYGHHDWDWDRGPGWGYRDRDRGHEHDRGERHGRW